MSWSNVKLILIREVRDQLRDRRTLFVIAVLPVLLYPLLAMSFLQVAQFMREKPSRVLIVGARDLADLPPLVDEAPAGGGPAALAPSGSRPAKVLDLHFAPDEPRSGEGGPRDPAKQARRAVERGEYDAAVYFPPDFAEQLEAFREAMPRQRDAADGTASEAPASELSASLEAPRPEIICSTANEKSQIAYARVRAMLERWRQEIVERKLVEVGLPSAAAKPFDVKTADVAESTGRRGTAVWSKVLPVLLLVWAMTGAFYPAIDLCAGEKERGTLETLLCSPAERSEIVIGKLVTIMLFSMATAVWNLVAMGVTGTLLLAQLPQFGPPPPTAAVWLSLALVPVSALFSALCLALAAFARSAKEGQYYLMPLLLVTMPLVVLPMAPGVELNLGNSLIPVTGVVLLLKNMLEGNFLKAWPFLFPVAGVTLACCLLAVRWAVEQFNSEAVLFRESERMDVGLWLRHLHKDRGPTPTAAAAVFCGVVILVVRFFMSASVPAPTGFRDLALIALVTQLAVIAAPALLMTVMLAGSARRTLLLRVPPWRTVPAAAALALVLYPSVDALRAAVMRLYPVSDEMLQRLEAMFSGEAHLGTLLVVIAVVPAICEELAFRGFILSGLRHLGHKWRAIVYSALFFGLTHAILQQQVVAALVGIVIGLIAVQSGSLWPCVVFHMIHNGLGVIVVRFGEKITPELIARWPALGLLVSPPEDGTLFRWPVVVASAAGAVALLSWYQRLPYERSPEEAAREALRRAAQDDE